VRVVTFTAKEVRSIRHARRVSGRPTIANEQHHKTPLQLVIREREQALTQDVLARVEDDPDKHRRHLAKAAAHWAAYRLYLSHGLQHPHRQRPRPLP
jgi:hypothetical protein